MRFPRLSSTSLPLNPPLPMPRPLPLPLPLPSPPLPLNSLPLPGPLPSSSPRDKNLRAFLTASSRLGIGCFSGKLSDAAAPGARGGRRCLLCSVARISGSGCFMGFPRPSPDNTSSMLPGSFLTCSTSTGTPSVAVGETLSSLLKKMGFLGSGGPKSFGG
ncbi:hypothetical protein V8G54_031972 [Vigna mungo]|uniref:Uncharacterized protein n=1 Tax=Vigna mungo TaxID=3915 RepID=A0AAQ3ML52_VIGMU